VILYVDTKSTSTSEASVSSTETPTRAAVVTGGSGGIGRAVAERLAADGLAVVVNYVGNAARAEEIVQAIAAAGG
jgi:3-oxoacyl-[acyl-carrier protein] reductase